ncbi:MAG: hypothetical protein WBB45_18155 [Cyclobacteriaceae bacterium]
MLKKVLAIVLAIILLAFFVVVANPRSRDFITSIIPGWHTTLYPWYITLAACLFIATLLSLLAMAAFRLILKWFD